MFFSTHSGGLARALMLPSPDADTRMFSFSSLHTQSYLAHRKRRGSGLASRQATQSPCTRRKVEEQCTTSKRSRVLTGHPLCRTRGTQQCPPAPSAQACRDVHQSAKLHGTLQQAGPRWQAMQSPCSVSVVPQSAQPPAAGLPHLQHILAPISDDAKVLRKWESGSGTGMLLAALCHRPKPASKHQEWPPLD